MMCEHAMRRKKIKEEKTSWRRKGGVMRHDASRTTYIDLPTLDIMKLLPATEIHTTHFTAGNENPSIYVFFTVLLTFIGNYFII